MKMTKVKGLELKSPAFRHNGRIPDKYTCYGANIHPPLQFSSKFYQAQSLVILMEDPDVIGEPLTHWMLWNIDPYVEEIEADVLPPGAIEGINSFNEIGYTGPCPEQGTHRYQIHLYVLDAPLALPEGSRRAEVEMAMRGHILAQTMIVGKYTGRHEINQRQPLSTFKNGRNHEGQ